jgi:hypothetical protein
MRGVLRRLNRDGSRDGFELACLIGACDRRVKEGDSQFFHLMLKTILPDTRRAG